MILCAKEITCLYGEKTLFQDISINIDNNDKIGLIGVNGTGKSTLLSVLSLKHDPDKGAVEIIGNPKISYMPQEVKLNESLTIEEYLSSEIKGAELAIHEAKSILTRLEIFDFTQKIKNLSGGTKRKLYLGMALAKPCDLLILDEPTNHLDSDMIEWLEKYLMKFNKALLLVTHDRYFLERVVNRIVELDKGKIYSYTSNYSKYLELKALREEALQASERKLQAFMKKEYEWIKRGPQARATKDKKRIEKYDDLSQRDQSVEKKLSIASTFSRLGNKTIEFENVGMQYDKVLFEGLTFNLNKNERIGVIGKNGAGKTTLLDIIDGRLSPTSGTVTIGQTIKIGYFKQENVDLDYEMRLIDYMKDIASFVQTKNGLVSATQMLENFLFFDPYVYIGKLSGGEKRRLILLGVLMSAPNVLLLDEPTNDLDITTLTILEDYLMDFEGIVITVSHDRFFLDKIAQTMYVLENQRFVKYNGNYTDYLTLYKKQDKEKEQKVVKEIIKTRKIKLTYNEEKEFSSILEKIDTIENRIKELDELININYSEYEKCKMFYQEKETLEEEMLEKMERWEYLSKKNEGIEE